MIIELVVFTARDAAELEALYPTIRDLISRQPGFVSWQRLEDVSNPLKRADYLTWESLEAAKAAGELVMQDERFKTFLAAIASTDSFSHYRLLP